MATMVGDVRQNPNRGRRIARHQGRECAEEKETRTMSISNDLRTLLLAIALAAVAAFTIFDESADYRLPKGEAVSLDRPAAAVAPSPNA